MAMRDRIEAFAIVTATLLGAVRPLWNLIRAAQLVAKREGRKQSVTITIGAKGD